MVWCTASQVIKNIGGVYGGTINHSVVYLCLLQSIPETPPKKGELAELRKMQQKKDKEQQKDGNKEPPQQQKDGNKEGTT